MEDDSVKHDIIDLTERYCMQLAAEINNSPLHDQSGVKICFSVKEICDNHSFALAFNFFGTEGDAYIVSTVQEKCIFRYKTDPSTRSNELSYGLCTQSNV